MRNEAYANVNEGFQFEISSVAVIVGNVAWHNGGGGMRVIESQHVDIYNNVLYKNKSAIDIWEGSRPQNVADVTIRNNVIMDGLKSATKMLDIDAFTNTLHRRGRWACRPTPTPSAARTRPAAAGRGVGERRPRAKLRYTSLAAFTKATGNDVHGIACDGAAAAKMLVNPPAGNFSLASGSPGVGAGVPLPSNVANALNVSPGVPVDLGLLGAGVHHGPGPTITSQPVSQSVLVGQSYSMSARPRGQPEADRAMAGGDRRRDVREHRRRDDERTTPESRRPPTTARCSVPCSRTAAVCRSPTRPR